MEKFDQIKYQNDFNKQRYDRITIMVKKGDKDIIKAHADRFDGGSVNAFIQRAITETMERDQQRKHTPD